MAQVRTIFRTPDLTNVIRVLFFFFARLIKKNLQFHHHDEISSQVIDLIVLRYSNRHFLFKQDDTVWFLHAMIYFY
jgi:hypothetical protein